MPEKFVDDELQLIRKHPLAQLLGVNPWTLDNWRKRGRIPEPIVLSPQIVAWPRAEILQWLDELRAKPACTRKPNQKRKKVA